MATVGLKLLHKASHIDLELYGFPINRGSRQTTGLVMPLPRDNPVEPNALSVVHCQGRYWQALPYPTLTNLCGKRPHINTHALYITALLPR